MFFNENIRKSLEMSKKNTIFVPKKNIIEV